MGTSIVIPAKAGTQLTHVGKLAPGFRRVTAYSERRQVGATKLATRVHCARLMKLSQPTCYANSMTFMLDVMNHPKLPTAMRMDAAKHLLPYQHARMGEQGKKEKAKERAHALAKKPRFRPKLPPHLTVLKGGRDE